MWAVCLGNMHNSYLFVQLCMLCAMLLQTLNDQEADVVQTLVSKAGW